MQLAKQQQQIKLIEEIPLHTFKTNIVNREFELHNKPVIGNINEDLDEKSINELHNDDTINELHNDDTINESINESINENTINELHNDDTINESINESINENTINELHNDGTINELYNDESNCEDTINESINESINENTINELHKNESKFERLIKYDVMMMRPNNAKPLIISFDEVDKYDFEKNAFIEFIISEDFVHLYFDFDTIDTIEELNGVINWLESLKCVFGEYSIGGYTNEEEVAKKYGFRYYKDGGHYVSFHVVYYQTMISTKDLQMIMKHTEKGGFQTKGVHKLCDSNVYKLVSMRENQTTRQLFRHCLSNKIYHTNQTHPKYLDNKRNHGFIINNTKPSQQIVQVRGNERIVSREDWAKVFSVKTSNASSNGNHLMKTSNASSNGTSYENHLMKTSNASSNENHLMKTSNDTSNASSYENHLMKTSNELHKCGTSNDTSNASSNENHLMKTSNDTSYASSYESHLMKTSNDTSNASSYENHLMKTSNDTSYASSYESHLMKTSNDTSNDEINWDAEYASSYESNLMKTNELLEYNERLIKIDEDDLEELLSNFRCEFDNLKTIGSMLLHSPFEKEFILKILNKWYFQRQHHNEYSVNAFVNSYYTKEYTNRWFYSIVNRIEDETVREMWRNRFKYYSVDDSIKIDLSDKSFTLSSLNKNNYRLSNGIGINTTKFLSDLKKVMVCINKGKQYYVLKDYDDVKNTTMLTYLYPKQFKERMESINIGKYYKNGKLKNVNAFSIYNAGQNKNLFLKNGLRFYDERPDVFSFFNGYDYNVLESVDMSKIELYLNHILEVIANNDEIIYDYILNWVSYIFQNISGKTTTAIVITGKQGTGKNIFANELCELMKRYSNPNVSNIDNVVGKFNVAIENKKLIVCNELSSAETNRYLNSDALKTIITENYLDINQKNEPVRTIENVVNLIFISNNFIPVNVEEDDRRYFMVETNDKYKDDFKYFDNLRNSFNETFHENLLTFFLKRDISKFDPRKIPMTKTKRDVLNATKTSYRLFVEEYIEEFSRETGWNCKESFECFVEFCKLNNFISCASNKFGIKLRDYVDRKRVRNEGKREYRYFIKENFKIEEEDEDIIEINNEDN